MVKMILMLLLQLLKGILQEEVSFRYGLTFLESFLSRIIWKL